MRLQSDVDLIVQLIPENIEAAFQALATLGYDPVVPVVAREFADPRNRETWTKDKGMTVLSFHSEEHREMPVDVFVDIPFDFDVELEQSLRGEVLPGLPTQFVSIDTLIDMKRLANRPRDHDDIEHLQWILEETGNNDD